MSYQLIRCKIKTLTPITESIFYIMNKVFKESIERRNEKNLKITHVSLAISEVTDFTYYI